jgi:hypothetical protein
MARRDEGAYLQYVTEEQRSQPGWILCPEGVDAPSQQGARSRAYWSI